MDNEVINIQLFSDHRGVLMPVEFTDLPFAPVRAFTVYQYGSFDRVKRVRGKHANKTCQQYFVCVKGSVEVSLFDGKKKEQYVLTEGQGIFIDKMIWNSYLNRAAPNELSVYLVLASGKYEAGDYIMNLEEFKKLTNGEKTT